MKTRLYFKQWVQDTLLIIELVLAMVLGGVADNINAPTEAIFIIILLMIINAIILMKYGRFEEKEDEE